MDLFIVIALAAFVAGFGVKAASAAAMEFAMAMSDDASMKTSACGACDTHGEPAACDVDCAVPAAILLPQTSADGPVAVGDRAVVRADRFTGRTGPPDPYPPRAHILQG
ncbi:MAG: hypothetical protein RIF44_17365 [Nitratireductor sp.]